MSNLSLVIISLSLLLGGCTKSKKNNQNHINYPMQTEISTLDPAVCYDEACNRITSQMYETLLDYDYLKRPYQLKPLLAEKMPTISKDGTRYTFKIKKGIFYQANKLWKNKKRELTAQDFIDQIKRVAFVKTRAKGWWLFNKKVVGLNQFRNNVKTIEQMLSTNVDGLSSPDKYTLVIELTEANPQFIYALAMNFTTPIPREAILEYKNDLREHVVATGAFTLKSWVQASKIQLTKNTAYRPDFFPGTDEKLPYLDSVTFKIIKEAPTRWLNFAKSNLDILELDKDDHDLAFNNKGELKKELNEMGIQRQLSNSLTYWWISFNMTHPLLGKNVYLRKAIAHAINRDRYITLFTNNLGLKANSIIPPGIRGHQDDSKWHIDFDLKKAREYLVKAGYPGGKGLPALNFDLRNSSSKRRQMGEFYRSQLKQIGINLLIHPNTFPGYLKKAREGKLEIWQDGWIMDYPDAENALQLLFSKNKSPGPNVTSFNNAEFDQHLIELKATANKNLQVARVKKMEGIIKRELPWHMLYYSRYNILNHKKVKNYKYSDVIHNFFKYLKVVR